MRWVMAMVWLGGCFVDAPLEATNPQAACIPVEDTDVDVGPDAAELTYLLDTIDLPESAQEASDFAFDIDRDELGRPDNALGNILSAIGSVGGGDIEGAANDAIELGQLLHLLTVRSDGFENSLAAELQLRHGDDTDGDATDNFSGTEVFDIDASRGEGRLGGTIASGRLRATGGQLPIVLAVPGDPEVYPIRLDVAIISATITPEGLTGRIGGGIPEDQVRATFFPFLTRALGVAIDRDCPDGVCAPDTFGALVLDLFDEDQDGAVSLEEIETNGLIASLFAPDLDLRVTDGEDDPGGAFVLDCDGENDSLSIGFGFTAVPTGN